MKGRTFTLILILAIVVMVGVAFFGSVSPFGNEGFADGNQESIFDRIEGDIENVGGDIEKGADDIGNEITKGADAIGKGAEDAVDSITGNTSTSGKAPGKLLPGSSPAPVSSIGKTIRELQQEMNQERLHTEEIRKVLQNTVQSVNRLQKKYPTDPQTAVDRAQSRHIEELREVLSNTITQLREDDILPAKGTPCGCASKPIVNPLTGEAEAADGCRPPGWMRTMELENRRKRRCDNCPFNPASSMTASS